MKHLRHTSLILSLVAGLLLAGGVLANQSTAHSLHHVHHTSTTHASIICSWMCAAGQVVEAADPILDASLDSIHRHEVISFPLVHIIAVLLTFDRGTPSLFL